MEAAAGASRQLLEQCCIPPEQISGIALSTAAHIGVLLDEANVVIRNAILWSDQRSFVEVEELKLAHGREIPEITFQQASPTWTLPHLLWVKKSEPQNWDRTRRLALSKDYVLWALTGRMATDRATAVSSLLFDARGNCWSKELCDLVGVNPDSLPEVLNVTDIAGRLTSEASQELGLLSGTPVVVGTLDSAAEMVGAGMLRSGQCQVRLATAGGIHLVVARPKPNPKLITYPHAVDDLWYCQAGTNSCASSVRWAIGAFGGGRAMSFQEWDETASAAPPGSEGLLYHPYLLGERCPHWDPQLRASFVGATMRHGPGHFARAVYEGTALSIRDAMAELGDYPRSDDPLAAVGGGTASRVWVQIIADVLGHPVTTAPQADSSYGAALLGLAGLGVADLHELIEQNEGSRGQCSLPCAERVGLYDGLFERYRQVHEALTPLYHHWADTERGPCDSS